MKAEDTFARVECEAGVIATLIQHPDFSFYSENLLPNHFFNQENRLLYQAITELARQGIENIDAYNIINCLVSSEATRILASDLQPDQINGFIDTSDLIARHTVEEYMLLVNKVLDAAFRRDTYQSLRQCESLCLSYDEENIQEKIYSLLDDVMVEFSTTNDIPPYGDMIDQCWAEIQKRQGSDYAGIPFKFPTLNEYATIERGELFIFGAEQKQGKSMMLLNCAVDLLKQGYAVLYLDSELSTRLFTARILSHITGIRYKDLTAGRYSPEEAEKISQAIAWLKTRKFTHIYIPMFDQKTIYTTVKKVYHTQGIDVLVVDYFKGSGTTEAFALYAELGALVDLVSKFTLNPLNCWDSLRAAPPQREDETSLSATVSEACGLGNQQPRLEQSKVQRLAARRRAVLLCRSKWWAYGFPYEDIVWASVKAGGA